MPRLPLLLPLALACADPPAGGDTGDTGETGRAGDRPAACADLPAVTWETWGEGFFRTWCQACHSASTPQRSGAPAGVDFDSAADVRRQADAVRRTVLETGSMPLGGGLSEDDQALLDVLLACGL